MKVRKIKKINLQELKKEQIELLYREGYTINEIMEQVDVDYVQVKNYLIEEGILKKTERIDYKKKEKIIRKLFQEGKSAREIGTELKIQTRIITYILRKLNLAKKKQSYAGQVFTSFNKLHIYKKKLGVKVRSDYSLGKSIKEIMNEHQISIKSVKLFLSKNKK